MIAYLDSSVLARAYLADEPGHEEASELLENSEIGLVTGSWTRIEVAGALVRACRTGRGDEAGLLALLAGDLGPEGPVTVVTVDQALVEDDAFRFVRQHGIRAMAAWHLAVALHSLPSLAERGEEACFASRDKAQAAVAVILGFSLL